VLALAVLGACAEDKGQERGAANSSGSGGAGGSSGSFAPMSPGDEGSSGDGDGEGDDGAAGAAGEGAGSSGWSSGSGGSSGFGAAGTGGAGGMGGAGGTGGGEFSGVDGEGAPSEGGGGTGPQAPQSGTLTAGTWDDNRNFERFREYRSDLLQSSAIGVGAMPTSDGEHAEAHELFAQLGAPRVQLDVALVIDTTGSMVDEITYLQTELSSISRRIEETYPNAEQHWSLIVYRDEGDAYVVREFDFTADVDALRSNLLAQSADGGGDFPEAPDAALAAANALAWRTGDDVARLLFWVADAPHHDENNAALASAVLEAQALGVHIYPVASSGIDELTELTMRSTAQLTGGRYLFLTNDSGVGGDHKEPTIPCYFVTKLDDAIVRMVDIEMSGEYREPAEAEILRTGGDPQDGACQLEGDEEAIVF
jgi:hypothetical protein